MDRNTILGFALIIAILVGYEFITRPGEEQLRQMKHRQDSLTMAAADSLKMVRAAQKDHLPVLPAQASADSSFADSLSRLRFGLFAPAAQGEKKIVTLENELVKVSLSTRGGKVRSVELKNFKTFDKHPLVLFDGDTNVFNLQFPARDNNVINTDSLYFIPLPGNPAGKGSAITMRLQAGEGHYIDYIYTLDPGSYMLGFTIKISGMNEVIAPNSSYIGMGWKTHLPRQEQSVKAERAVSSLYYRYSDGEVDYLSETKDEKKNIPTKIKWIAFKQQYFTSVLIADNEFDKPTSVESVTDHTTEKYVKTFSAELTLPYNHKAEEVFPMKFYFGPNHYQSLKAYGLSLEKQIPMGWGIFGWVNKYFIIWVFNFLNAFHLNYGLIIFILTIVVRLILLPLTYSSYRSMAKMKVLKPEVDEINARHKGGDPMKMQQEMMKLYRRAGVNPLGGCIPGLLQMPILIAMFRFFPASIELRQQGFLWAHDLSTYDSVWDFGYVPFINGIYGDHVSLFTILMTISTILYTKANSQQFSASGPNAQMTKWMMYIMPLVFLGFLNNYAAALSYYYFLSNVMAFGQQYLFRLMIDEKAIHKKIQENKNRPQSAKKSRFQQKLEEMAKSRGYKLPK